MEPLRPRRGKPLQRQRHRQQLLWGQLRALGTAGGEVPSATSGGRASAVEDVAWMNGRKMDVGQNGRPRGPQMLV